jgi:hypothetical protein
MSGMVCTRHELCRHRMMIRPSGKILRSIMFNLVLTPFVIQFARRCLSKPTGFTFSCILIYDIKGNVSISQLCFQW